MSRCPGSGGACEPRRGCAGQRVDDVVSMSDLAPQERATLRSIAREVNGVRRKLEFLSSMPN